MYVILDIVINHTADCFRYKGDGDHPFKPDGHTNSAIGTKSSKGKDFGPDDAIWPVELQDPGAFKRRGSITNLVTARPAKKPSAAISFRSKIWT